MIFFWTLFEVGKQVAALKTRIKIKDVLQDGGTTKLEGLQAKLSLFV